MSGYTKPGYVCADGGTHAHPCDEPGCDAGHNCCEHCQWDREDWSV